jgi:hypothetical protein
MHLLSIADTAFCWSTECYLEKHVVDQRQLPLDENVCARAPCDHLPHAPQGFVVSSKKHADGQTKAVTEAPAGSAQRARFREPQDVPKQIDNPFRVQNFFFFCRPMSHKSLSSNDSLHTEPLDSPRGVSPRVVFFNTQTEKQQDEHTPLLQSAAPRKERARLLVGLLLLALGICAIVHQHSLNGRLEFQLNITNRALYTIQRAHASLKSQVNVTNQALYTLQRTHTSLTAQANFTEQALHDHFVGCRCV